MSRLEQAMTRLRTHGFDPGVPLPAIENFIRTGDKRILSTIPPANGASLHWPIVLGAALLPPEQWEEFDRRTLRVMYAGGGLTPIIWWLQSHLEQEPPGVRRHDVLAALLRDWGAGDDAIAAETLNLASYLQTGGRPNSAGSYLLRLPDSSFDALLKGATVTGIVGLLRIALTDAPDRAPKVLKRAQALLASKYHLVQALVESGDARFLPAALATFQACAHPWDKVEAGRTLLTTGDPALVEPVYEGLREQVRAGDPRAVEALAPRVGARIVDDLMRFLSTPPDADASAQHRYREVVSQVAAHGGQNRRAALLVALDAARDGATRLAVLEHLIALSDPSLEERIHAETEKGIAADARTAAKFIPLAAKAGGRFREPLWAAVGNKSKLVREAAGEALAASDPEALARATALFDDRSKDRRSGAVLALRAIGTPAAIDVLLNRLAREEDGGVRDETAAALRAAGVGTDAIICALGPADPEAIRRKAAAVRGLPVRWLREEDLRPLRTVDGGTLDPAVVRWVLHRQAKQAEPFPDPEAAPVYAMIDRRSAGDFAHALLERFLEASNGKGDAWVLIVAGLLGDARVITSISAQVRKYADGFNQKLGEWAVEALAQNGSDAALLAVDAVARKYADSPRRKHAIVGEAARNAIELAARRMGLTLDELGDRIVPWLGFEPGRPRRVDCGKGKTIEASIGLDFKLVMTDVGTGKKASAMPKSAPPEVQADFKGLGKLVQELAKAQAARLEGLMVRQHRWPAARWKEFFLAHPLLLPFAVRLIWGAYDASGRMLQTFRALPDRTLTDAADAAVDVADAASVGVVHPLEVCAADMDAWRQHCADYEVEPPFPQVDRPAASVAEAGREALAADDVKGASLNALSFRAKAETSGWRRGTVGDGAMVSSYRKRFEAAGVDAYVTVDGLPAYADPSAQVTLGHVTFVPSDAKSEEFGTRALRLGDVPPIVYSESVGDLQRIAGRSPVDHPPASAAESVSQSEASRVT